MLSSVHAAEPACVAPQIGSATAAAHAPYAGRVIFIQGSASAQSPGAAVRIRTRNDPVCQGDTLASGDGAMVQLNMADGGKLVLRPKTRMTIDTFANPSAQD